MKKIDRKFLIGLFILCTILFLVDRYYWAQISQWREDQVTNLWLGYTRGLTHIPVGLISSQKIPNPNGMVIAGYFLSHLPNLLTVSMFLGISQIILIILVARSSSRQNWKIFLLVLAPALTSVILRSTSIEFWNQYLLTFINLLFLLFALKYLEKPSLWLIPPIAALICIAPSLYLAGIVNSLVITILTIGIVLYKRPAMKSIIPVAVVIVLIVLLSIALTWMPYFKNINLQQITGFNENKPGVLSMVKTAWESFFAFPSYTTFQWGDRANFTEAMKHADIRLLSSSTNLMLKLAAKTYLLQALLAFSALIYGVVRGKAAANEVKLEYDPSVARIVVLSGLFIIFSYTFSAWLGGPAWINNIRLDQVVQFLPMSLFVIFLLPALLVINGRMGKIISTFGYLSLILFSVSNLICGFMIIQDHLQYRGDALTEADVPLVEKMQAVKFIADDWRKHSDLKIIPVDYRLGGGRWDWGPEFGLALMPWYPAPYTDGRGFDYSLQRQYGLTNQQEGVQLRTFGSGRYLVTYAFEDAPKLNDGQVTNYIFGRLRVSIVER